MSPLKNNCAHEEISFRAEVAIFSDVKLPDARFAVSLSAFCSKCNSPLLFVGMPVGLHPTRPTVSPDFQEVRLHCHMASELYAENMQQTSLN